MSHPGPRRRGGLSFIELMIVVTIIGVLVGVAVPYVQDELRAARSARTRKELQEVQKVLGREARRRGLLQPVVPGTPHSIPRFQRPEYELPVTALIPDHFAEVPKDAWGREVYRFGNYLMSNGDNGLAGDDDDVWFKVTEFPIERDPSTGVQFMESAENEAYYQAGALALRVRAFVAENGAPPETLDELYAGGERGSGPDPWGNPFRLVNEGGNKTVASAGPDQAPGSEDDIAVPWDEGQSYSDSFRLGFRQWIKIFPTAETPTSTPLTWVDSGGPGSHIRFDSTGVDGVHGAAWVKPPPPGTQLIPNTQVRVRCRISRAAGPVEWGLLLHYNGPGSGVRGTMTIAESGGDAVIRLDTDAPGRTGEWFGKTAPSPAFAGPPVTGDSFDMTATLGIYEGSPGNARFTVSGGAHSGSITVPLPQTVKPGSAGIFVRGPPPGSKFTAEFDDFVVSP